MGHDITNKTSVQLGVVPTHHGFVGGLVPEDEGKLPRNADGQLVVLAGMQELCNLSRVKLDCVQAAVFPGTNQDDFKELCQGLKDLDLALYFILMVGGADPMNPDDESAIVDQLLPSLEAAKNNDVRHVSSTSVEAWMAGPERKDGADFEAAVAQNAKLHTRAYQEAGLAGSCVEAWHIEFLRPVEFKTFTDLDRIWTCIRATNEAAGTPFFKALLDAAHCGDSGLSIPENEVLIARMGAAGDLGCYHASAKTTRGCLSTDDGWIGALMTAAARAGSLEQVFVEAFTHTDPALEGLRAADPGHGIDTTDGRSYTQLVADGLADVARRLNNLKARGIL